MNTRSSPRPVESSLARKAARGAAWSLLQNVGCRALAFVGQIILARILLPEDFGLIGLVLTANALIQPLLDFGVEDVLMSRRRALKSWIRPAYGLSVTLSFVAGAVLVVASPVVASLYKAPELTGLILLVAISCPVYGVSFMPLTMLRSELRFGLLSAVSLAEAAAVQVMSVLLAWMGFGAYSFVIPIPVVGALRSLLLCAVSPIPLRGTLRLGRWRILMAKGLLVFVQRFVQIGREQGDYILLGFISTQSTLGFYFLGFRLAAQPVYMLVRSLGAVLFPAFAHLTSDRERQTNAAIRASRLLNLVVIPSSFLQAATADPLVRILFGDEWLPAVPFLQILSIGLAFDVLPCVSGALATARGQFGFQLRLSCFSTSMFAVLIAVGAAFADATGVAWGVALYFVLLSVIYPLMVLRPSRGIALSLLWLSIEPTAMAAIAVAFSSGLASQIAPHSPIGNILITTAAGGLLYLALLALCARSSARELFSGLSLLINRAKPSWMTS